MNHPLAAGTVDAVVRSPLSTLRNVVTPEDRVVATTRCILDLGVPLWGPT